MTQFRSLETQDSLPEYGRYYDVQLVTNETGEYSADPARAQLGIRTDNGWLVLTPAESLRFLTEITHATSLMCRTRGGPFHDGFVEVGDELLNSIYQWDRNASFKRAVDTYFGEARTKAQMLADDETRAIRRGLREEALDIARREVKAELRDLMDAASAEDDETRAAILSDVNIRAIQKSINDTETL